MDLLDHNIEMPIKVNFNEEKYFTCIEIKRKQSKYVLISSRTLLKTNLDTIKVKPIKNPENNSSPSLK